MTRFFQLICILLLISACGSDSGDSGSQGSKNYTGNFLTDMKILKKDGSTSDIVIISFKIKDDKTFEEVAIIVPNGNINSVSYHLISFGTYSYEGNNLRATYTYEPCPIEEYSNNYFKISGDPKSLIYLQSMNDSGPDGSPTPFVIQNRFSPSFLTPSEIDKINSSETGACEYYSYLLGYEPPSTNELVGKTFFLEMEIPRANGTKDEIISFVNYKSSSEVENIEVIIPNGNRSLAYKYVMKATYTAVGNKLYETILQQDCKEVIPPSPEAEYFLYSGNPDQSIALQGMNNGEAVGQSVRQENTNFKSPTVMSFGEASSLLPRSGNCTYLKALFDEIGL